MRALQDELKMAVLFVTHDMAVVAEIADRVVVLRRGEKVEEGSAERIFAAAEHPYTRALLAAVPRLGSMRGKDGPHPVPGTGRDSWAERPPVLQVRDLT